MEGLRRDNKGLRAGRSHNLGQNFARAFGVQYQTAAGGLEHVWNTSWGVSTRLVGGLIMTHSDDNGLIAPPKLAPVQAVTGPICKMEEKQSRALEPRGRSRSHPAEGGVPVGLGLRVQTNA